MRTFVVTGSAGGIGSAVRSRLEAQGDRVIGVDRRDAEVIADLGAPDGRAEAVSLADEQAGGTIDGVVVAAGVLEGPGPLLVSVNYFGALAVLDGLRPALARADAPAAVAVSSNSATAQAVYPVEVSEACLSGDEEAARAAAAHDKDGFLVYAATKLALARWVRRTAPSEQWMGAGICLNAVAPGLTETPMTAHQLDDFLALGHLYPMPAGRVARPEEIAGPITFLLGPDARYFCGSYLTIDGGTDAALNADAWPAPPPTSIPRQETTP